MDDKFCYIENYLDTLRKTSGVFPEDNLNIAKLIQLLERNINSGECYQLDWVGKQEAYNLIHTPTFRTLLPDHENSINWHSAENVFIEGENLDVLKILQNSHLGKVKLILIDPPYNTGKNFIYSDQFAENKKKGQNHSNWLSMMLPRLYLARNLLRDDGATLVHIDENEHANLKLLLNEVFGENNSIGEIIWDKGNPKGDSRGIAAQHENILVYAKNRTIFLRQTHLKRKKENAEKILKKAHGLFGQLGKVDIPEEVKQLHRKYKLPTDYLDTLRKTIDMDEINLQFKNWLKRQGFKGGELAYNNIDPEGNVYRLVSMAWPNKNRAPEDYFVPLLHPVTKKYCPVPQMGWRFSTSTMKVLLEKGEIIFGKNEKVQPQKKYLLKDNMFENIPSILTYAGSDDNLLKKLGIKFEYAKPVDFTKSLVLAFTNSNTEDLILDFFAGSGTTAHATLQANEQDSGNRKFICIQLPEQLDKKSDMFIKGFKTISEVTRKRIKCIINESNIISSNHNTSSLGIRCYKLGISE